MFQIIYLTNRITEWRTPLGSVTRYTTRISTNAAAPALGIRSFFFLSFFFFFKKQRTRFFDYSRKPRIWRNLGA